MRRKSLVLMLDDPLKTFLHDFPHNFARGSFFLEEGATRASGYLKTSLRSGYRIFTARATISTITISEIDACKIIRLLALRESTGTSVGDRAVLVLKARKR